MLFFKSDCFKVCLFFILSLNLILLIGCAKPLDEELSSKTSQSSENSDIGRSDDNSEVEERARFAPKVMEQPESVDQATLESTVRFSVSVEGYPKPEIQWMKGDEVLLGETGSELVISEAFGDDFSEDFYAVITNSEGSVETDRVNLGPDPDDYKPAESIFYLLGKKHTFKYGFHWNLEGLKLFSDKGYESSHDKIDSWGDARSKKVDCKERVGVFINLAVAKDRECKTFSEEGSIGNYVCYRHIVCSPEEVFNGN